MTEKWGMEWIGNGVFSHILHLPILQHPFPGAFGCESVKRWRFHTVALQSAILSSIISNSADNTALADCYDQLLRFQRFKGARNRQFQIQRALLYANNAAFI
jgi:hypothetical protein